MRAVLNRVQVFEILGEYLKNKNLVKHSIAVEAGMRSFARFLGEDPDRYAIAGLLHDLDYELTKDDFPKHGFKSKEILMKAGFGDMDILDAIVMHSGNIAQTSKMGQALYAVDPATGLIVACVLMHPEKKLAKMDLSFVVNRFNEKRFAQGANREQMRSVETNFGLSYEKLLGIVLDGMIAQSDELGF